jgi:alkyl sulfatase BDS1-like metallo-beta-lactamase superfamily hydrolase
MRAMTPLMVLDNCGVKLNTPRANGHEFAFHISFSDHGETHELVVHNGVFHVNALPVRTADAVITTTVESLVRLTGATSTIGDESAKGTFSLSGDQAKFETLIELLDQFEMFFAIIEP